MSRNLICPHCKSEDVIQTLSNFRTVKFWIFKFRFPTLKKIVCYRCKTWAHESINGESPEHIKKLFSDFESKPQANENIRTKEVIPSGISSEALDSLFRLKVDESKYGKLPGGCF
jgi:hypothetical protein